MAQETSTRIYSPSDKKRIALLDGAVGQKDRLRIRGQIVDIPVSEEQKEEEWDHFLGLPLSLINEIQPLQDFAMSVVRRPRLQIEVLDARPAAFSPKKAEDYKILYSSEVFTAGDDSFFSQPISPDIAPGNYVVRVMLRGIDSLRQSVADLSYVRHEDSLILKKDVPIGYGRICVLPEDYSGYILTSDIDQTFLDTPMHSRRGLLEILFQKPQARKHIPGMPQFYRSLQQSLAEGDAGLPTLFISASPHFFRRSLSVVFEKHKIEVHALHLKYLVSTIDSMLEKFKNTILNFNDFLSGGIDEAMDRTWKFIGSSLASLVDQIAYKLGTLLENRLMQPTGAKEILMGDNTEGDYLIFVLYQYLLLGRITGKELENYFYKLRFQDREALTRDTARRLARLVEENLKVHGPMNSVRGVWINLSKGDLENKDMDALIRESLPKELSQSYGQKTSEVQKPLGCYTGVGFALAALDAGLLSPEEAVAVVDKAKNKSYLGRKIDAKKIQRVMADFPFQNIEPQSALSDIFPEEMLAVKRGPKKTSSKARKKSRKGPSTPSKKKTEKNR